MTQDRLKGIIRGNAKHPDCAVFIWESVQQYINSQNSGKPNVIRWLDFREQKPEAGQLVIIRSSQTGQQQIINWSRLFSHLLKLEYDRWYPLPDID
jgi:hypothetical protein